MRERNVLFHQTTIGQIIKRPHHLLCAKVKSSVNKKARLFVKQFFEIHVVESRHLLIKKLDRL